MQITWKEFKEKVESLGVSSVDILVHYSIKEESAFIPSEEHNSIDITRIEIKGIINFPKKDNE